MKRFHVHVAVPNLDDSIRFYSTIFGAEPAVVKPDYAKWMLDDPRVNFAISERGAASGINHLGLQVDSDAELQALHSQLQAAGSGVLAEKNASCCYAKSDKYWVTDPAGVPWETFHSLGNVPFYNGSEADSGKGACCAPDEAAPTEAKPETKTRAACC